MRLRQLAVLFVLWSCTVPAAAQEVDESRARIHFQAGREYFAVGRYEQALQEFQRAHATSARTELHWNIALCQERLGRYGAAADSLQSFLDGGGGTDDRPVIEERIRNLRARAASSGGGEGMTIGAVTSYSAAGVGAVLAVVFGVLALDEQSSLETCRPACAAGSDDSMRQFALVSDIGTGVAIVGAALGTSFLVLGLTSSRDQAALTMYPWFAQNSGGVFVGGAF